MPRPSPATGTAGTISDARKLFKYGAVALCYLTTHLVAMLAFKTVPEKGKKTLHTVSRFAAGVCLGTAMIDLLSDAHVAFLGLGMSYPLAFVLSCAGYVAAFLTDCLLVRLVRSVGRDCYGEPKLLDKIMLSFVREVKPIKCCDTTLPAVTSKSETKDCDAIGGYARSLLFHRLTVLEDSIVLVVTFVLLSMPEGDNLWSADTTSASIALSTFCHAMLKNGVYSVTLVFCMLRTIQMVPYVESLLFILGTSGTPISFTYDAVFGKKNMLGVSVGGVMPWAWGTFSGFLSGVLLFIAIHHLLLGRSRTESRCTESRFGKIMVMFCCGVGTVAVLKLYP